MNPDGPALLDPLIEELRAKSPRADEGLVRRAFAFADQAHQGQVRRSGAPFISHAVETARILMELLGPHLDSITAAGPLRSTVTVSAPDSLSDSLQVQAYATPGSNALNLKSRRIVFTAAVYPGGTTTDTLVPSDTIRTTSGGLAVVQVRYTGGSRPDSIVITATARHHDGSIVPGSPITFVVGFLP